MGMYLLAGILGIIFQTLIKMKSTSELFKVSNEPFIVSNFFRDEYISILSSIVFILIMAFTFSEWINYKHELENYTRLIFTMGGAIGSWAFGYFLGKSKKYIKNVIDSKTDIADGKDI